MPTDIFSKLSDLVVAYGAWGVFWISVVEEIIAPIPSTLTLMGAGSILLAPYKTFGEVLIPAIFYIAVPAALGVAVGGLVIYALAYFGERIVIDRLGKWLDLSEESIEKTKKYFQSGYGDEAVLLGLRAIPIFPNSLISAVCGFLHYPVKRFFLLSFLGGIPRALLMTLLGWWAGEAYARYADIFSGVEGYALAGIAAVGLAFLLLFFIKRRGRQLKS